MTALKWLLLAVAGYGALLVLMYVFQRSLMYFPDTKRTPPALAGLPQAEEVVLVSSDGEKLIAWHVPPRAGKKLVIYFQGNAGGLDLCAERFGRLTADGTGVLALCYRGYGGSTGSPGEAGLIRDALAAYDYAVERQPAARIVLWGESLGTGVAVALAAERDVGGVILDAPFSSIADVGAAAYPLAPVRWLIKDPFHSDRRIARVHAPLLIRHGEGDAVVPIRFGQRLFALANEPKRFERFAGEGHVITDERGGMDSVRAFLAEN
jgi:uncharacterized protein